MGEVSWHDFPMLMHEARKLVKEFPDRHGDILEIIDIAVCEANDGESISHEEELGIQSLREMAREWSGRENA